MAVNKCVLYILVSGLILMIYVIYKNNTFQVKTVPNKETVDYEQYEDVDGIIEKLDEGVYKKKSNKRDEDEGSGEDNEHDEKNKLKHKYNIEDENTSKFKHRQKRGINKKRVKAEGEETVQKKNEIKDKIEENGINQRQKQRRNQNVGHLKKRNRGDTGPNLNLKKRKHAKKKKARKA